MIFALFVLVPCLVCPLLPMSFKCPVLIAPSGFSNVCLYIDTLFAID